MEELEEKVKRLEYDITTRDRVITELRLRLPASQERDEAIAKATAHLDGAAPPSSDQDYPVKVAQTTVASLQARLEQKQQTIAKFDELLKNARDDLLNQAKRHEIELKNLQEQLHAQREDGLRKLRKAANQKIEQTSLPTNQQLRRLNELEDEVAERDNSLAALRDKLAKSRHECHSWKCKHDDMIKSHSVEVDSIRENHNVELSEVNQQLDHIVEEVRQKDDQIAILYEEIEHQKRENVKAPTTAMKQLVDRLKSDLKEKEKQQAALSKTLKDLRSDMVKQAQNEVQAYADQASSEIHIEKVIEKRTRSLQDDIEQLEKQVTSLKKSNKIVQKEREHMALAQEEFEADKGNLFYTHS